MINTFEFASKNKEKFYHSIDLINARTLFEDYNIYFNYYNPKIGTHFQEFDIYKLDSAKDFKTQYEKIKTLCFPDPARIFFYTDYKTNDTILKRKILIAKDTLALKNKTFTVTNLHELTKIRKEVLRKIVWEMSNEKQGVLNFEIK